MNKTELEARVSVQYNHYVGMVELEALSMIDMIVQQIIPACSSAGMDTAALSAVAKSVQDKLSAVHHEGDDFKKAQIARELRLETMIEARSVVDAAEALCPSNTWPIATYRELLFLDSQQDGNGQTTVLQQY